MSDDCESKTALELIVDLRARNSVLQRSVADVKRQVIDLLDFLRRTNGNTSKGTDNKAEA